MSDDFDRALDDYLHTIARVRPWTKRREEALLTAFAAWRHTRRSSAAGDASFDADAYVRECGMSDEDAAALRGALASLRAFAARGDYSLR